MSVVVTEETVCVWCHDADPRTPGNQFNICVWCQETLMFMHGHTRAEIELMDSITDEPLKIADWASETPPYIGYWTTPENYENFRDAGKSVFHLHQMYVEHFRTPDGRSIINLNSWQPELMKELIEVFKKEMGE